MTWGRRGAASRRRPWCVPRLEVEVVDVALVEPGQRAEDDLPVGADGPLAEAAGPDDLVVADAIYFSNAVDITAAVIAALAEPPKPAAPARP